MEDGQSTLEVLHQIFQIHPARRNPLAKGLCCQGLIYACTGSVMNTNDSQCWIPGSTADPELQHTGPPPQPADMIWWKRLRDGSGSQIEHGSLERSICWGLVKFILIRLSAVMLADAHSPHGLHLAPHWALGFQLLLSHQHNT